MGHPIRLKLLCIIASGDEACVSDLWHCLKQPQPVISQHLAILKESGIVASMTDKTKRRYSIIDPFVEAVVRQLLDTKPVDAKRSSHCKGKKIDEATARKLGSA